MKQLSAREVVFGAQISVETSLLFFCEILKAQNYQEKTLKGGKTRGTDSEGLVINLLKAKTFCTLHGQRTPKQAENCGERVREQLPFNTSSNIQYYSFRLVFLFT